MQDELTAEQVDELTRTLEALRDDAQGLISSTRDQTRPVALDEPIGRLTRMDAIQQQAVSSANRRDHDLRLRLIRQALNDVARGTYGTCRRCEDPIGYRRLQARPESPYCLDCQDEVDRRHGPR